MTHDELRERASTLASRAIGGADLDKLAPARDALFSAIIDALIEFNPKREVVDVRELRGRLDALTGAGVEFRQRQRVVQSALRWVTALVDRLDAPCERPKHTRPFFIGADR